MVWKHKVALGVLPRSLVGRVFTLYTITLLTFTLLSLGLFYRYQFELALEDAQQSALMLTEITAQTISESAVIGDYDTIQRTLEKVISRETFVSAEFIDLNGGVLRAHDSVASGLTAPVWLEQEMAAQLSDVNQNISVGMSFEPQWVVNLGASQHQLSMWRQPVSVESISDSQYNSSENQCTELNSWIFPRQGSDRPKPALFSESIILAP